MKTTLLKFSIGFIGLLIISSSVLTQAQTKIAYWNFNENSGTTAADEVGDNTGTLMGTAAWSEDSKEGSAILFDGTEGCYVSTELIDPFLEADDLTIMAWFKVADIAAQQHILWVGEDGGNGWGDQSELHVSVNHYGDDYQAGNLNLFYGSCDNDQDSGLLYVNEDALLSADTWYHVAAVVKNMGGDIAEAELYLDGVLLSAIDWAETETGWLFGSTATGNPVARNLMDVPFRIGGAGNTNRFFNGLIDEVRIYDDALSVDQINDAKEMIEPSDLSDIYAHTNVLYPNPSKGVFNISNDIELLSYQVFDMNGRELANKSNNIVNSIDLGYLQKGIYLIKMTSPDESLVQRIIIE